MNATTRVRLVAALSLVFTYLFFFEYLPPFRWVDIPYDLAFYHYPLDDFAFQSLRHGHIPEWDPNIYCGLSFIGNPQTAMFYPPMWPVFLANAGQPHLKYRSLQILVVGHVWLAFLFCFIWLRNRGLTELACALGAGVFAYSGYLLLQLQHFGLVCAYAWIPLGFWSIDQAASRKDWRPMGKLALAGTLCLLAGHPPTALVCCTCFLAYAAVGPVRWKTLAWASATLGFSVLLAMVQLLPAWEATALKEAHQNYGAGIRDPMFYVSYLIPNFFDFGLNTSVWKNPGYEYLYLGAPALFGLLWIAFHPKLLRALPGILAVGAVSLVAVTNPFGLVWTVIQHSRLLADLCRSWYFLAGITPVIAGLAAVGLDDFMRRQFRAQPSWLSPVVLTCVCAWCARLMWMWHGGGMGFAIGWASALDAGVMLTLFCVMLLALRNETGVRRRLLVAMLLIGVGIDYKAFGTSKRFNADRGSIDRLLAHASFPGMDEQLYRKLTENPGYRVALDRDNPTPTDLRHYNVSTPQGGDPLGPAQYHAVLAPVGPYYGPLEIDPANQDLLRLLGVRYYITSEEQPLYSPLKINPAFQQLQPQDGYFKVFEFTNARPSYYWKARAPGDWIRHTGWSPETREFVARSATGGKFILVEQFFPGWQATVDDRAVRIERWHSAFQSILVPPGEHRIRFTFRSQAFRIGALISGLAILVLAISWLRLPAFHAPFQRDPD